MLRRNGLAAIGATGVALLLGVGGVSAATRSSDERTLTPVAHKTNAATERKIDALISKMTLEEKLDQLTLLSDGQITDAEAAKPVGAVFSLTDPVKINHFQHIAVDSRGCTSRSCSPSTRSTATGRSSRSRSATAAASIRASPQTDHRSAPSSRPRSASSRSTARWSTSRTSRAGAASPRRRARTRT